jgi:5-methylcytosine-specific restriction endonuclease McrA
MPRPSGFGKRGATPKYLNIISKDPCVFCGEASNTIEHIEPKRLGLLVNKLTGFSRNHWTNIAPSCEKCNHEKGGKRLLRFLVGGGLKNV